MSAAKKLRKLLAHREMIIISGVYDCLSAKLVEQPGNALAICRLSLIGLTHTSRKNVREACRRHTTEAQSSQRKEALRDILRKSCLN